MRRSLNGACNLKAGLGAVRRIGRVESAADALKTLGAIAESAPVAALARAFRAAGFDLALVGGPVRDAFLGRTIHDLDFTTNARPEQILEIIRPLADAHWETGREFGTIGARVAGEDVEITTFRADLYDGVTRKPEVTFGDSLEEDLVRRDFTVNAMALLLDPIRLVDPFGGIDDVVAQRLRTPRDVTACFTEDPLRMLRAARFVAQLGFVVDEDIEWAMHELRLDLERISAERIRDELVKLLCANDPVPGIQILVRTGLADVFMPEISALKLETDEHHHHKDVYEHSLTVLTQAIEWERVRFEGEPPNLVLRLAALLHDIGKPQTRRFEPGGAVSFYHHDVVGAKLAKKRLRELRFDNDTIDAVAHLVELHLRFFGYSEGAWSDSAVRRYVRDAGAELPLLHILTRADVTTRNRRKAERLSFAYDDLEQRIAELSSQEELNAIRPDLDGEQIMDALALKPGPVVGRAYKFLLELRLDEGPLGEDEARTRLMSWWQEQPEFAADS
jgi:poly(A) polymerase